MFGVVTMVVRWVFKHHADVTSLVLINLFFLNLNIYFEYVHANW